LFGVYARHAVPHEHANNTRNCMREQHSNHAASSKDMNSNDKAPAISKHDDANNKKRQNLMPPNHLQKKLLMRRSRLKGPG
jgi:hypothetical protein